MPRPATGVPNISRYLPHTLFYDVRSACSGLYSPLHLATTTFFCFALVGLFSRCGWMTTVVFDVYDGRAWVIQSDVPDGRFIYSHHRTHKVGLWRFLRIDAFAFTCGCNARRRALRTAAFPNTPPAFPCSRYWFLGRGRLYRRCCTPTPDLAPASATSLFNDTLVRLYHP